MGPARRRGLGRVLLSKRQVEEVTVSTAVASWCELPAVGRLRGEDEVGDGLRLDSWLTRQRAARCDSRLSPDQIAALDELGVRW
ncbi:helicase associated domain-containing protein [Streptomyces sp. NPDC055955]|uniref:helicase associated domain-containing protein n=1 Tax=Streptomyces sp. NPDC055955 TaxID=3345665 RepID=UPI0035DDFB13